MVRKTMVGMQKFASNLQDVIQSTEDTGNHVADFYEKLEEALADDQLAMMPKTEFQEIIAEFNDATEVYEANTVKLQEVNAPVKLMGLYANFKKHYAEYAVACRAMVNAIDVEKQFVDQQKFNAAGDEQENQMDKISVTMQKMMAKL